MINIYGHLHEIFKQVRFFLRVWAIDVHLLKYLVEQELNGTDFHTCPKIKKKGPPRI